MDSGEEAELTLGGAERHGAEKGSLERGVRETEREGPGLPGQQDEQGQVQTLESRNQLSWTLLQERHDSPHVRGELRLTCSLSGKDSGQSRMELPTSSIVTIQVGATGRHGVTPRADVVKATLEMDSTSTQLQVDRSTRRQSTD